MKQKKTPATSEEVKSEEVKEEQQSVKIYPDIDFNRKERRKSLIYGALLVILMGGMGASIFIQGLNNPESSTVGYLMGAIMLIFVVIFLSMIPSSFKQYPVDGKADYRDYAQSDNDQRRSQEDFGYTRSSAHDNSRAGRQQRGERKIRRISSR